VGNSSASVGDVTATGGGGGSASATGIGGDIVFQGGDFHVPVMPAPGTDVRLHCAATRLR
jgi:hypothetical protein